ncbi:MAG: hypothetical protein Q4E62_05305 [Sutterellaceae bacterium]|nr:hypothetical protein [Sutterellaceae bacterium]
MPPEELLPFWNTYEGLSKQVDDMKLHQGGQWKSWCFLPRCKWDAALASCPIRANYRDLVPPIDFFAAIGTWRYSKGHYKFDPDVYRSLIETGFSGNIPCEALTHLPEWCVYIETPDMKLADANVSGCFVYLDDDPQNGKQNLFITILDELFDPFVNGLSGMISICIPLGDWSIEKAFDLYLDEISGNYSNAIHAQAVGRIKSFRTYLQEIAQKVLCLALYLCADEPDIVDQQEPSHKPGNSRPKVEKGKLHCFPAKRVHNFDVGLKIGAEIRKEQANLPSAPTGRTVESHLRRGHWHKYWIGPRKASESGQRKLVYKWLSAMFVHGRKVSDDRLEDSSEKTTVNASVA